MWHKVAKTFDLKDTEGVAVEIGEKKIAVFLDKGKFYAVEGTCPHRGGPLAEGRVEDGEIVCPWHAWAFVPTTGKCRVLPGEGDIAVYPTKVEGDDVYVDA